MIIDPNFHQTVGFPAVFWLHMNYGQYFRTTAKTFLTVVNLAVLAISCAIVSIPVLWHSPTEFWPIAKIILLI